MRAPQVVLEALQTSGTALGLVLQAFDELEPVFVVVILPDHLKSAEMPGNLEKVLIADIVLFLRPYVAVAVDQYGIVSFIEQSLQAACRTRTAAAVDQNLLAHAPMILYYNEIDHIISVTCKTIFPSVPEKSILSSGCEGKQWRILSGSGQTA